MTTPLSVPANPPPSPAVEWLLGRINYERTTGVPYHERQLKLDRMRQLVNALGSPDTAAPIIHIAGTKGKGSTAAMIAAMLTTAGYRTGLYSSPHLHRVEERFVVDGAPIDSAVLCEIIERVRPIAEELDRRATEADDAGLTFFDITTAIALLHFAQQGCQAVVLEVGLGGRLDSTNVCLPTVSVITSISFDHTRQLGNTLASIASEKAGIIKPGVPVISGVAAAEPREVIAAVAREHGCRLMEVGTDFGYAYQGPTTAHPQRHTIDYLKSGELSLAEVELGMAGEHQGANAAVALAVVDELVAQGWKIPVDARRSALAKVALPGRFECIAGTPAVVLDTAHNQASAEALVATLTEHFPRPRTLVLACSKDKDVPAIVRPLAGAFERVVATRYIENPRAVPQDQLAELYRSAVVEVASECAIDITEAATPGEAWEVALAVTPPEGVICITGSFFLAAELRDEVLGTTNRAKRRPQL